MAEFWSALLWNSLFAAALGLATFAATRLRWLQERPRVGHALWLLVFVKLITPPLFAVPILPPLAKDVEVPAAMAASDDSTARKMTPDRADSALESPPAGQRAETGLERASIDAAKRPAEQLVPNSQVRNWSYGTLLLIAWGTGTCLLIAWAVRQSLQIRRIVRRIPAPCEDLSVRVAEVARELGLSRVPETRIIDGAATPMLCLVGFRPVLVLPKGLIDRFDREQFRYVVGHELAHYARHDHWTNAFAFLVTAVFWWHPITRLALRELRATQELCCDAVVVGMGSANRRVYAEALLLAVDFLREERSALPQLASGIGRAKFIHRRFEMLASTKLNHRFSRITRVLIAAAAATFVCVPVRSEKPPEAEPTASENITEAEAKTEPTKNTTEMPVLKVGKAQPIGLLESDKPYGRVHFDVEVAVGRRFYVSLMEVPPRRGYSIGGCLFEKEVDGAATVQLQFEYLADARGAAHNPLLSEVNEIQYSWNATKCAGAGATSIFGVPLNKLPESEKKIIFVDPQSEMAKTEMGVRVLLIVPKDANPTTRSEVEAIQPRGEVTVLLEPQEPKKKPTQPDDLMRAWLRESDLVGTAVVKYRVFRRGADECKPLSLQSVCEIFGVQSMPLDGETALARVSQLLTDEGKKSWRGIWGKKEFRSVGIKTFEKAINRSKPSDLRYYDGEIDLNYDSANRQLDLHGTDSRVARMTLNNFRIPAPSRALFDLLRNIEAAFPFPPREIMRLETSDTLLDAELSTGFIYRLRSTRPYAEHAMFQFDPKKYPGGIVFPRVYIDCRFQDNALQGAEVIVIDEARFNDAFEAGDFKLPLPKGTHILDYRNDPLRPASHTVESDITDAAEYVEAQLGAN